jgi:hypothetical protein
MIPNTKDITGQTFGRLTVLRRSGSVCGMAAWECRCVCGNECRAVGCNLRSGHTQSCGCLQKERAAERSRTHGLTSTREYWIWSAMMERCENPNSAGFVRYGARGIRVCERWRKFENFYADMGPRPSRKHSIERVDNEKGYEPSNCCWATAAVQANNRRSTHKLTFLGKTQNVKQWAEDLGVKPGALYARLDRGWPVERALSVPVR